MTSNFDLRLQHLEDNIKQDQDLLKKYEDALRYEDDPRRQTKYTKEITQLRESAKLYQKEYDELKYVNSSPTAQMQSVEIQLQQVHRKLDKLYTGQKFIYKNINHLRQGLFNYYKDSERNVIAAISEKLDESQIKTISTVLSAVENNQIPEAEILQIVEGTQQIITVLEQKNITLPSNQQATVELIKAPEIDTKHRLKIFLPIIPILLSYEGELELGSGINLKAVWQKLLMRIQGE